jgi:hypothetical protein
MNLSRGIKKATRLSRLEQYEIFLDHFFILATIKRIKFIHVGLPNKRAIARVDAT